MFSRDNWKEIFQTIQKNKLRTFLSGFTVALGIFIFVVLFGFGNGLINTFDDFFGDDGGSRQRHGHVFGFGAAFAQENIYLFGRMFFP